MTDSTYLKAIRCLSRICHTDSDISATISLLHECDTWTESSRRAQYTDVVLYEIEICIFKKSVE